MSPRDLPLWARGAALLLVWIAAWYVPRSESLATTVGFSSLELSAGVVAVSLLLGMRLPLDLWPQQPERDGFSLRLAVAVAAVMGVVILLARSSEVPAVLAETDRGLLVAIVVGGTAWALACGRIQQRIYLRWYSIAAGVAVLALLARVTAVAMQPTGWPAIHWTTFFQLAAFFFVAAAAAALVTQELAFRRILIGQAGDAGLAVVLIAAVAFGVWHALALDPGGGMLIAAANGTLHGVVLGSLYSLSRSRLGPAVYHGAATAGLRAFELASVAPEGATVSGGPAVVSMVVTGAVAAILAFQVNRRSGFMGLLTRRQVPDAPSD